MQIRSCFLRWPAVWVAIGLECQTACGPAVAIGPDDDGSTADAALLDRSSADTALTDAARADLALDRAAPDTRLPDIPARDQHTAIDGGERDSSTHDGGALDATAADATAADATAADATAADATAADATAADAPSADHHGGDAGAFVPVRCQAAPAPACASATHELPIPTHFDQSRGGHRFMASDVAQLVPDSSLQEPYTPGACYPLFAYGLLPDAASYIAADFSATGVSDDVARSWAEEICQASGVPVRHLWPPNPSGPDPGAGPRSDGCELQAVHDILVDGSLITVLLPPGWSARAPAGSYPIALSGLYDLNANTFGAEDAGYGRFLARAVARSSLGGRRGVIGVLWNGGGAHGTLTMHPRALEQFARLIDLVAQRYRGNRNWIVTFGGSRAGYTALAMASNPHGRDYRVVLASAVAPPTRVGDLVASNNPTYPGMYAVIPGIVGFKDAWMGGWRYPACAGRPYLTGLGAAAAALQILTGSADPAVANQQLSPAAPLYLDGLQRAGTQVYVELTEHDAFVPYLQQIEYGLALVTRGIPAQIRVLVRAGHGGLPVAGEHRFAFLQAVARALTALSDPGLDLDGVVPPLIDQEVRYYRANRQSQQFETFDPGTSAIPFSVELPHKGFAGQQVLVQVTGQAGTPYLLEVTPQGGEPVLHEGVIPDALHEAFPIAIGTDHPELTYQWRAAIRRPTGTWIEIPTTSTPTTAPCTTAILTSAPVLGHLDIAYFVLGPQAPGFALQSWGLSEF